MITASPPVWASSAGIVSIPADLPLFNDCTAASTFLRRMRWSSPESIWGQFCVDGSPLVLWLYSSEQYSLHRFGVSSFFFSFFFCEAFSWTVLDSSSFPLFHRGQVFHKLVCTLTVLLPQIFFSLSPIQFSSEILKVLPNTCWLVITTIQYCGRIATSPELLRYFGRLRSCHCVWRRPWQNLSPVRYRGQLFFVALFVSFVLKWRDILCQNRISQQCVGVFYFFSYYDQNFVEIALLGTWLF